jgi:hypothetical protein
VTLVNSRAMVTLLGRRGQVALCVLTMGLTLCYSQPFLHAILQEAMETMLLVLVNTLTCILASTISLQAGQILVYINLFSYVSRINTCLRSNVLQRW